MKSLIASLIFFLLTPLKAITVMCMLIDYHYIAPRKYPNKRIYTTAIQKVYQEAIASVLTILEENESNAQPPLYEWMTAYNIHEKLCTTYNYGNLSLLDVRMLLFRLRQDERIRCKSNPFYIKNYALTDTHHSLQCEPHLYAALHKGSKRLKGKKTRQTSSSPLSAPTTM